MSYRAIVFDYGGVISANFSWQQFVEQLPSLQRFQNFRQLLNHLAEEWNEAKIGGDTEPFWDEIGQLAGQAPEKIQSLFIDYARPLPEMLELADRLAQNYRVGLLSNQIADWLGPIIEHYNLQAKFNPLLTSYQLKVAKPDPRAFELTAQALKLDYSQILFIDDLPINVAAAKSLGIESILFSDHAALLTALTNLNIRF